MSWYGNLEEAVSKHDGRSRIVKSIKTLTLLFTEAWYTKRQGKVLEGARPWCHRIGRRGQFVCRDNACGRSEAAESLCVKACQDTMPPYQHFLQVPVLSSLTTS